MFLHIFFTNFAATKKNNMARKLTEGALKLYMEGGKYHEFLEIVKEDKELAFEIRVNNSVMIYCEKNLILTIAHKSGYDNITMLSPRYINNRKDGLKLTQTLSTSDDLQDRQKVLNYFSQAKALCKNYKSHEEFKVQQWYKSQMCSFSDKCLGLDMEWRPMQKNLPEFNRLKDATLVDLLLVSNTPNENGEHDLYLAEVKCGLGALEGASGLVDHLKMSKALIEHIPSRNILKQDAMSLIEQKSALGLLDTGGNTYRISKTPKILFILAYSSEYQKQYLKRAFDELEGAEDVLVEYLDVSSFIPDSPALSSRADSAYKVASRQHEVWFREEVLGASEGKIVNWLTDDDAAELKNFVPAFHDEIEDALYKHFKRKPKDPALMNDMLSSKCVPWNFFVPMMTDMEAASNVIGDMLGFSTPIRINNWEIERTSKDLADRTAYDMYIEYETADGLKGVAGIEVKYTEEGYSISENEYARMKDPNSRYSVVTRESGCFKSNDPMQFNNPGFIQIWRNHMLGLALLQKKNTDKVDIFHSVTLYPSGNTHFASSGTHKGSLELYSELLTDKGKETIVPVTYEHLLDLITKYYNSAKYKEWIDYMKVRYVSMKK